MDDMLTDTLANYIKEDKLFMLEITNKMKAKILNALDDIDVTSALEDELDDLIHYICYDRLETYDELVDYIVDSIKAKLDIRFKNNEGVQNENKR